MAYEIEVAVLEAQPMLSIQASTTPGQIAEVLGQLFGKITALANKRQAQIAGQPFTRYHAFDEKTVVLEAGIPVVTAVEGEGEIKSGELPAGAAAMTIHTGPYSRLAEAHVAIDAWLNENGKKPAGLPWEVYVTDPGQVKNAEEWKTQVIYPIT